MIEVVEPEDERFEKIKKSLEEAEVDPACKGVITFTFYDDGPVIRHSGMEQLSRSMVAYALDNFKYRIHFEEIMEGQEEMEVEIEPFDMD